MVRFPKDSEQIQTGMMRHSEGGRAKGYMQSEIVMCIGKLSQVKRKKGIAMVFIKLSRRGISRGAWEALRVRAARAVGCLRQCKHPPAVPEARRDGHVDLSSNQIHVNVRRANIGDVPSHGQSMQSASRGMRKVFARSSACISDRS